VTVDAERHLLDTSAVLTLIEDEPGADRVEALLRGGDVLLPWTVLLEAHYVSQQERGRAEADRRYALLLALGATVIWEMDEPILLTASEIKAQHRVSLADALIAAYAVRGNARLVHKDPEYAALEGVVPMEALPYKGG
jgi:predicted nucleic acid-binding protein